MHHELLLKDAFNKLEKSNQQAVCDSIQKKEPFLVRNGQEEKERHVRIKSFAAWQQMRNQDAIYMLNLRGDNKVVIFKGDKRFEALLASFRSFCFEQYDMPS